MRFLDGGGRRGVRSVLPHSKTAAARRSRFVTAGRYHLPAARCSCCPPQPGLEHGHHLHPIGARLRLPGGDRRLVLAPGAQMADQQQHGSGILCRLPEGSLAHPRQPETFNSDQGSQFTSEAFTGVLKREGIVISMDGRGRAFDNIFVEQLWRSVKHEDVYLKDYATMGELMVGLAAYFAFYNGERPRQSLGQKTPDAVYRTAIGGGAVIKFPRAVEEPPVERSGTGFLHRRSNSKNQSKGKTGAAPSSC